MRSFVRYHIVSEMSARRFAWGSAFLIGAFCTALVLKALPEFNVWASFGLVASVALTWVVLGSQLPNAIRV